MDIKRFIQFYIGCEITSQGKSGKLVAYNITSNECVINIYNRDRTVKYGDDCKLFLKRLEDFPYSELVHVVRLGSNEIYDKVFIHDCVQNEISYRIKYPNNETLYSKTIKTSELNTDQFLFLLESGIWIFGEWAFYSNDIIHKK